jgi:hypothetical protein
MAIYEVAKDGLKPVLPTTFAQSGLRERSDLQRLLRSEISIISPDTLVISEEFGEWEESNRRIDLLGIDQQANIVVIELKRTEDGGHMELQALRYAAMVSTMTFDRAVEVFGNYLKSINSHESPREALLSFLNWEEPDEDQFAQDVRIVLASAEFGRELTTTVLWLAERGIDIRCVRLKPYTDGLRTLIDVQQVLPLPEAEDYRVQLKAKQQKERLARANSIDRTKFTIRVNGNDYAGLSKRAALHCVVRQLLDNGAQPEHLAALVPSKQNRMFRSATGTLTEAEFLEAMDKEAARGERAFDRIRFYCGDDELFRKNGKTYAFTNQWGTDFEVALKAWIAAFPQLRIEYLPTA